MTTPQPQPTPETTSHQQDISRRDTGPSRWTGEKIAWWIVFGVLVLSIFTMLSAWN